MAERASNSRTTSSSRSRTTKSPEQIVERARQFLGDLAGVEVERVTGLETDDDGNWLAHVEAVEVRRIPDTADIMAKYEVRVSKGGQFRGYRQLGRRLRGQVEELA